MSGCWRGALLCSSKSGVEQPSLRLTGQIQGCTASQLWSRDDAPGLSTLAELGVLVGAGECSSGSGSCGAGAWGAEGRCSSLLGGVSFYANAWEQLPCRRDSFPALVSHSGQASLAKAFFSPSLASPPSLPNAEGWDVHLLSPWQDEAGFSGNCVKATKPPYILKKTPKQPNKKSSTIFSYSFFLSMMETGGQTGSSALPPPGAAPSPETRGQDLAEKL